MKDHDTNTCVQKHPHGTEDLNFDLEKPLCGEAFTT